MSLSIYIHTI